MISITNRDIRSIPKTIIRERQREGDRKGHITGSIVEERKGGGGEGEGTVR